MCNKCEEYKNNNDYNFCSFRGEKLSLFRSQNVNIQDCSQIKQHFCDNKNFIYEER